ncbi:MAG: YihY/virulence factor BrkB family protein [Candidatus Pseudobacter hemicellulosilyticus]|uniref:YihY/virulence factor BrkB family protein n=1 Tax=Candidatus Pseudobacter hemicellulosilyticus TaxID=3121375 RepID=A0AAJ5WPT5_9BACT|nr:MAG: YihY/virulence factor BrkB family protein [Pseudobacter sp.]
MKKLRRFFDILKKTVVSFLDDNGLKLSASLSYYTIFALGPVLVITISLVGIFYGKEAVQGKIYGQIKDLIGSDAAIQLQQIIKNVEYSQFQTTGIIIGLVMLLVGASGVFTEMQDSINTIWSVKAKPKKGWLKFLRNRLLSFSLVISIGFILLVSLVVSALLEAINTQLTRVFPEGIVILAYILNILIVLFVIAALFTVIFKVLPDATISWRDTFRGALFTSLLFMVGKFLISFYISRSSIGTTYGAATSIIVILLWVYYSSAILYLGAEFTKTWAIEAGNGIKPNDTAVFIIKREAREVPSSHLET